MVGGRSQAHIAPISSATAVMNAPMDTSEATS